MDANPLRRSRLVVTAVFFANGLVFSSLFARLPAIKADLGLSDGELGVTLLFSTAGLVAAQVYTGAAVVRWGARDVLRVAGPAYALAATLPALAPSVVLLAVALLALGSANGALDLTMNVEGAAVERRYRRPIMSSLHAAFSFGALVGAGSGALVAAAGVPPEPHLAGVAVVALLIVTAAARQLSPDRSEESGAPMLARPSRELGALGLLAFCVLLAEGSVADWSGVYLRESMGSSEALAAAGLAAFSLTMAVGRLVGDRVTAAVGRATLAGAGSLVAGTGLALAVAVKDPAVSIAGFAAMGTGLATTFPLVVSAAANRVEDSPGASLAAVTTAGYTGFVIGPPAIGFLSEAFSLRTALLLPVVACLVAAALSPAVSRSQPRSPAGVSRA
jgi:MFS family permease